MKPRFVTIVVPTLNEADNIEAVVRKLKPCDGSFDGWEIVVVDGGSTDGTVQAVERMAAEDGRVRLLANPGRIQAIGVNLAAEAADPRSTWLVRADAHCAYDPNFASMVVAAMETVGAQSAVVPMYTVGPDTCFQAATAVAQNSVLGNGGSSHRLPGRGSGWVDHGHHAGFDLAFFRSLGGYDESFAVNEDAEYDVRVAAAGGRVWLCDEAEIAYFPRKTPAALVRQYFRYGQGRAKTVGKHGMRLRPRQLAPAAAFLGVAGSLLAAPLVPLLAAVPLAYFGACMAVGVAEAARLGRSRKCGYLMGFPAAAMHLAWGAGFLQEKITGRDGGKETSR